MHCNHCGGKMLGDGETVIIHCERLSSLDHLAAPDSAPVHCGPVDGDTLTTAQIRDGWHYCPAFDGLLTQGEGPNGTCYCGRDDQVCSTCGHGAHHTCSCRDYDTKAG